MRTPTQREGKCSLRNSVRFRATAFAQCNPDKRIRDIVVADGEPLRLISENVAVPNAGAHLSDNVVGDSSGDRLRENAGGGNDVLGAVN